MTNGVDGVAGARHLVVLVHGFQATPGMMEPLARAFRARGTDAHCCVCNGGMGGTLDGVEAGGERVANEMRPLIAGRQRVTIVGHSLGGLYLRVVLHRLQAELSGAHVDVCTLSSPHEGGIQLGPLANFVMGRRAARRDAGILRMVEPDYLASLKACRRVVLVGSLTADLVPGLSAVAARHGVRAPDDGRVADEGSEKPRRVVPVETDSAEWAALEQLPNLERYCVSWCGKHWSPHNEIAAHYGPYHFLWPAGCPDRAADLADLMLVDPGERPDSKLPSEA